MSAYVVLAIGTFAIIFIGVVGVILHDSIERAALAAAERTGPSPLTREQLDALLSDAADREQRVLENLSSWGGRSAWAGGVMRVKTRAYLPDGRSAR